MSETGLQDDYFTTQQKPYTVTESDLDSINNYLNQTATETRIATRGGTGLASYVKGDLIIANSTSALKRLPAVATGSYLRSNGVGADPSWATLNKAAVAGLKDTDNVTFNQITSTGGMSTTTLSASGQVTSTVTTGTAPMVIASTTKVTNLNADKLDGQDAPSGTLVGTSDVQTLANKTLTTPTIGDFTSAGHTHANAAGGGQISHDTALTDVSENDHHNRLHAINSTSDHDFTTPLSILHGGTGISSVTQHGVVLASSTTALTTLAEVGAIPRLLVSQNGGAPSWQTPTINLSSDLSGSASMDANGDWTIVASVNNDSHTHDTRYYTESEVDTALSGKSDTNHTHDTRYYTESEIDSLLAGKSGTSHTHDNRYYTESEVDDFNLFGSGNKQYVSLAFIGLSEPDKLDININDGSFESTAGYSLHYMFELVGVPRSRGSKVMYMDGMLINIGDADTSNYIDVVYIMRDTGGVTTEFIISGTNYTSPGTVYLSTADYILDYDAVKFKIISSETSARALNIISVQIAIYWD